MIPFLILATALVAGALLLVVPPMIGAGGRAREDAKRQRQAETVLVVLREQLGELEAERAAGNIGEAEYQRSREELELRALEEGRAAEGGADLRPARKAAIALIAAVPVVAAAVYLMLGDPRGLDPVAVAKEESHQITPEQMTMLVAQLAERLERQPEDVQGWLMLGRSYSMMKDFEGAAATWRRIGANVPDDADVLADWADLLAVAAGRSFDGDPERLVQRAIEIDPNHVKALALAGTAAFHRADYAGASAYWERILAKLSPDEPAYQGILGSINEARGKGGMALLAAPQTPPGVGSAAAASALTVSGTVSLAPQLAAQAGPDDVVFVFARPAQGGIPLAALRLRAGDLPATFSFENAQRMSQGPLPAQISVGARLSKQGNATPQAGDLEGEPVTAEPNESSVEIVIDRVRN